MIYYTEFGKQTNEKIAGVYKGLRLKQSSEGCTFINSCVLASVIISVSQVRNLRYQEVM